MQGPEVTAIPEAKSWCGFRGVWAKGGSGLEPPQLGVLLGHTLRRADSTFAVINPHGEKRLFPSPVLTHILTPAQRQLPRTGSGWGWEPGRPIDSLLEVPGLASEAWS